MGQTAAAMKLGAPDGMTALEHRIAPPMQARRSIIDRIALRDHGRSLPVPGAVQ
jgi:hypothetical protein